MTIEKDKQVTRFRFRKRYFIYSFFFAYLILIQSSCFTFRKNPTEQTTYLIEQGQESPHFPQYEIDGQQIQYTQVGQADGSRPAILFLHGSPGSSEAYLDYLADKELSELATLISVDRPGFGYSGFGKTEPSLQKQSLAMRPIIENYKGQKIILVGHSYGGPLAARMAIDFPHLIDGIVLVAPSIDPTLEPPIWWRKIINWWGIRWMIPSSLRVCNQEVLPLKNELERMLPHWKDIKAKAIIVQGSKDKLVPKGNADFAAKMLINSQKVVIDIVEGGNHFILWSEKERIKKWILDMI